MPSAGVELRRWRNAVFALFLVNGVIGSTWGSRLPAIREDTSASLQVVGVVLLAGAIGAIAGLSLGPILMHRFGARWALALGYSGALLGLLTVGLGASVFGSIATVAVGLFVWGLSIGAGDVVTNIEAAANERAIGKTLMPLMHGFFSIGTVLGAIGGAVAASWHIPVLLNVAAIAVLSAAVLAWAISQMPAHAEVDADERPSFADRRSDIRRAWAQPVVLLIGAGVLANGFAEGGAGDWVAIGAVDGHGLTQSNGALLLGTFTAGMTIMRLSGGPLVDRFGRVSMLRISALVALTGVAIYVWGAGFWLLAAGCLLWGAGVALGFPLAMSAAADHPNGPARVSVVSTIGYGAFLVGPPLLGFMAEHVGVLPALTVFIALLAIAALVAPAAREASGPHART